MARKVPFFMCLLYSVTEMMGPDMSKGILQRVGESIAKSLVDKYGEDKLKVNSLEELLKEENPLNYFDDTLGVSEGKLFILEQCPFKHVLDDFLELYDKMPNSLNQVRDAYNDEGLGWAVSPYCIIHQTFRAEIAKHITVNGKPCKLSQLGCKASNGVIKFANENIQQMGLSESDVEGKITNGACIYAIEIED